MPGYPLGPCGNTSEEQDIALGAQIYLMERFSCGPMSVDHLEEAIEAGRADKVADYVAGSWKKCDGGSGWCELLDDIDAYQEITELKPDTASRFSATFDLAVKNGIASPNYAMDRLIGKHPAVKDLFRFNTWTCGSTSAEVTPHHFQGYGTIKFPVYKPASVTDLGKILGAVLEVMFLASGKKIDPNRIEVVPGPTETRTIYDVHLPKKDGMYQTHEEQVPTVIIHITRGVCVS